MADPDIPAAEARDIAVDFCRKNQVKLDWFELEPSSPTRYNWCGCVLETRSETWKFKSHIKVGTVWHSVNTSAPLLRQALLQWSAHVEDLVQRERARVEGTKKA